MKIISFLFYLIVIVVVLNYLLTKALKKKLSVIWQRLGLQYSNVILDNKEEWKFLNCLSFVFCKKRAS